MSENRKEWKSHTGRLISMFKFPKETRDMLRKEMNKTTWQDLEEYKKNCGLEEAAREVFKDLREKKKLVQKYPWRN